MSFSNSKALDFDGDPNLLPGSVSLSKDDHLCNINLVRLIKSKNRLLTCKSLSLSLGIYSELHGLVLPRKFIICYIMILAYYNRDIL